MDKLISKMKEYANNKDYYKYHFDNVAIESSVYNEKNNNWISIFINMGGNYSIVIKNNFKRQTFTFSHLTSVIDFMENNYNKLLEG